MGSTLATLGTLQPRAFRSLNHVDTLDSVSNYYLVIGVNAYIMICVHY